ncbi:hypothetical protein U0070_014654, partial [Myodes glareolus]
FQLGFTLGNVVGMYLAQNYDLQRKVRCVLFLVILLVTVHTSARVMFSFPPGLIGDVADLSPGRESVQVEEANSPSIDGHHHYHQANDIDSQASFHLRDKSQKTLVILSQQ